MIPAGPRPRTGTARSTRAPGTPRRPRHWWQRCRRPRRRGRSTRWTCGCAPRGGRGRWPRAWPGLTPINATRPWTWEHLALTRARVVAGPRALSAAIEAVRQAVLDRPREAARVRSDTGEMRRRLREAGRSGDALEIKAGPGGLQDITLLAQTGALLAADPARDLAGQLCAAAKVGLISAAEQASLVAHAELFESIRQGVMLLAERPGSGVPSLGEAGARCWRKARARRTGTRLGRNQRGRAPRRSLSSMPACPNPRPRPMRDKDPDDPKGLIREAYRIEGISEPECRSIFMDWALSSDKDDPRPVHCRSVGALRRRQARSPDVEGSARGARRPGKSAAEGRARRPVRVGLTLAQAVMRCASVEAGRGVFQKLRSENFENFRRRAAPPSSQCGRPAAWAPRSR